MRDADVLVDVRYNAISHKPGLSKTRLGEALRAAGVEYVHERSLGVPKDGRDAIRAGDHDAFRRRIRDEPALAWLAERARTETVALLCAEREPDRCHRSVLADEVVRLAPGTAVEHR